MTAIYAVNLTDRRVTVLQVKGKIIADMHYAINTSLITVMRLCTDGYDLVISSIKVNTTIFKKITITQITNLLDRGDGP